MADNPFESGRKHPQIKRTRFDGKPLTRTALVATSFYVPASLDAWYHDRAAIMGVPYSAIVRDVLTHYRNLVRQADAEAGFSPGLAADDVAEEPLDVPERLPGYRAKLTMPLRGTARSHLDPSPLGIDEL